MQAIRFTGIVTTLIFLLLRTCESLNQLQFLGQPQSTAHVSHAAPPGTIIYTIFVINGSYTRLDNVRFTLLEGDSSSELFELHSITGQLTNLQYLPLQSWLLQVKAEADSASTLAELTVVVKPEYETRPVFERNSFNFSLSEYTPVGSLFGIVRAFSLDQTRGEPRYSIISGNAGSDIAINDTNGMLLVSRGLDYETVIEYNLMVEYTDGIGRTRSNVHVVVFDENDNRPHFSEVLYHATVSESDQSGSHVITVTAQDLDSGQNSEIEYSILGTENGFTIDEGTGEITTSKQFDYEEKTEYAITVIASDKGDPALTTSVIVEVQIFNENDECAVFPSSYYDIEVPPSVIEGEVATMIEAVDPDNIGIITYSLYPSTNALSLNPSTGSITLADSSPNTYTLTMIASDGGECESNTTVVINVASTNIHSPRFTAPCEGSVTENSPAGTIVATLEAEDDDTGVYGDITFTFIRHTQIFSIDPRTGDVIIKPGATIDYEEDKFFLIHVLATDISNKQAYCLLNITVQDVNDNAPVFLNYLDNEVTIPDPPAVGMYVTRHLAEDLDSGVNGEVEYSLVNPQNFAIDPTTGEITVASIPMNQTTYSITVMASNTGANPILSATEQLTVILSNDGIAFNQSIYHTEICENYGVGLPVIQVSTDDDVPALFYPYVLVPGSQYSSNGDGVFTVDVTSGEITVSSNENVDYERLPNEMFLFSISVHTSGISNFRSTATVEILVKDYDDNPPYFPNNPLHVSVPENSEIGTTVATVPAIDPDSGTNGEVAYSLESQVHQFNVTESGDIITNAEIDAENGNSQFTLAVFASNPNPANPDSCGVDQRGSAFVLFTVSIVDINDNAPMFTMTESSTTVSEDTQLGTIITTFTAIDADVESDSSDIRFSITEGNTKENFILTEGGILILVKSLDYEEASSITLTITVTDGVNSNTTEFTISVTNIDDEQPVFDSSSYSTTITENAPLGTTILEVSAEDIDTETVLYRLTCLAEGRFSINEEGFISVSGIIDHEEFDNGILSFTVVAEGGPIAIANVTVNITDVNDCIPRFLNIEDLVIQENISPGNEGVPVGSVTAFDADSGRNGEVVYSLTNGQENGFVIDPQTGEITAHMEYNREEVSSYTLLVEARDMGENVQLSSITSFQIKIGDENDNSPYFPYPYMYTRVFEDTEVNSVVFNLPAIDLDEGTNAKLVFSLLSSKPPANQYFDTNETTGAVRLIHSLDYENGEERFFTLSVSVTDPMQQDVSYATLDIEILDRNDNEPVVQITQRPLGSVVPEDTTVGTVILELFATDEDSGSNADVMYSIVSGDPSRHFNLVADGNSGALTVAKELDYETTTSYNLVIQVCDQGILQMCSTLPAELTVGNIDDIIPSFSQPIYRGSIRENSGPVSSILQVEATDPDFGERFEYAIQSGNIGGRFSVNSSTGVIGSTTALDREEQETYTLAITAADKGGTPLTGTGTAIITVSDEDDNPPADVSEWRVFMLLRDGTLPESHSIQFYFGDPDSSSTYSDCSTLSSQQTGVYFSLDENNCFLDVNKGNTPINDYSLRVQETNQGLESTVKIDVAHISSDISTQHLVTLSLETNIAESLENIYSTLPNVLSSILGVSREQITILSIQGGYYDANNTVDVSFFAVNSDGSYLNPVFIIQSIYKFQSRIGYKLSALPTDPCANEPCAPQASCIPTTTILDSSITAMSPSFALVAPVVELYYKCECIPGTGGDNCSINYNDCYSNPCQYGGECIDEVNGYRCDCPPGTSGDNCQISPNGCFSNPCLNGAECRDIPGSHSCLCLPGYYGPECQYHHFRIATTCESSPCLNGGTCSPGRDSFTCLCSEIYSGPLCEENSIAQDCSRNPCFNGSTCMESNPSPVCSCSVGFTGPHCRWPIDNCELEPCLNGGTCATGLYGSYQCYCLPSFTGDSCEKYISGCDSNPCQNGGRCIDISDSSNYTCECQRGFTGTNCEYEVEPRNLCLTDPCTMGNCTYSRDSYTCSCPDNYSGDLCNISTPPVTPCKSNPCLHGGQCTVIENDKYTCSCSAGFTGKNCENNINDCSSNPCVYGTCRDGIDGYTCECSKPQITGYNCQVWCPSGYIGPFCDEVVSLCDPNPCMNGGTCVEDRENDGYWCVCPPTHTGASCEEENTCNAVECFNGGSCTTLPQGGFGCACTDGFEGSNCQLITVSFNASSSTGVTYRAYPSLHLSAKGTIEFEFNTIDYDGLLLYNTQLQSGMSKDYIAVEVRNGRLAVSLSYGGESVQLTPNLWISDGHWHHITIVIFQKSVSVTLDWCHELDDEAGTIAGCHLVVNDQGERGFLDLGLPLWLGGAPSISAPHVSTNTITACLRQVIISGTILDLNAHVDESNSQPGCLQLEDQCTSGECGEGECISTWSESPVCDCPPLLSGDLCNTGAPSLTYSGSGYAQYSLTEEGLRQSRQTEGQTRSTYEETVSLVLRTTIADGFLFGMYGEDGNEYLYLMMESGQVVLHLSLSNEAQETELTIQPSEPLNDSESHNIIVHRRGANLNLSLDSNTTLYSLPPASPLTLEIITTQIYTGGSPFISASSWFNGCLHDVRLNRITLPTTTEGNEFAGVVYQNGEEGGGSVGDLAHGVTEGCRFSPCYQNPCGSGGVCLEVGNNSYLCDCFTGEMLLDGICSLKQEKVTYLPYVIAAAVLIVVAALTTVGIFIFVRLRRRRRKMRTYLVRNGEKLNNYEMAEFFSPSQAVVISNEQGGGEVDADETDWVSMAEKCTPSTVRKSSPQTSKSNSSKGSPDSKSSSRSSGNKVEREKYRFHLRVPEKEDIDGEEEEEEEGEEEGFRSNSPVIRAYLEERVDAANNDLLSVDSLRKFEEEGSEDSEVDSLSSVVCHSNEDDEDNEEGYTLERLQAAGPPLSSLAPLLRHVLESTAEISTRVSPSSTTTTLLTPYNTQ